MMLHLQDLGQGREHEGTKAEAHEIGASTNSGQLTRDLEIGCYSRKSGCLHTGAEADNRW